MLQSQSNDALGGMNGGMGYSGITGSVGVSFTTAVQQTQTRAVSIRENFNTVLAQKSTAASTELPLQVK